MGLAALAAIAVRLTRLHLLYKFLFLFLPEISRAVRRIFTYPYNGRSTSGSTSCSTERLSPIRGQPASIRNHITAWPNSKHMQARRQKASCFCQTAEACCCISPLDHRYRLPDHSRADPAAHRHTELPRQQVRSFQRHAMD